MSYYRNLFSSLILFSTVSNPLSLSTPIFCFFYLPCLWTTFSWSYFRGNLNTRNREWLVFYSVRFTLKNQRKSLKSRAGTGSFLYFRWDWMHKWKAINNYSIHTLSLSSQNLSLTCIFYVSLYKGIYFAISRIMHLYKASSCSILFLTITGKYRDFWKWKEL